MKPVVPVGIASVGEKLVGRNVNVDILTKGTSMNDKRKCMTIKYSMFKRILIIKS